MILHSSEYVEYTNVMSNKKTYDTDLLTEAKLFHHQAHDQTKKTFSTQRHRVKNDSYSVDNSLLF